MKALFIPVILNLFDITYSVDAGGVNRATNGNNSYVINAYGNTVSTSGNDFTPQKAKFYARNFMKNYEGKRVHTQFGQKQTFPKHSGDIVNIRGMSPYPVAKTPLTEGVTPQGNLMKFYYVEVPVHQYGAYTPITDYASFASRDQVLVHDSEELASQASRTIEELAADALSGGMQVIFPDIVSGNTVTPVTQRSALTAACKFNVNLIFRAVNYLEVQDAPTIGDSYVAIIHPNVKYDVMNDEKFISITKYQHADRIFKGEIGTIGNVRFVVSTNAKVFQGATISNGSNGTTTANVYSTIVLGKDAYTTAEIEGEGMHNIIKPLGSGGTSDPLNQRATQGWKTTFGIGITCETNMVRIETVATYNTLKTNNFTVVTGKAGYTPMG